MLDSKPVQLSQCRTSVGCFLSVNTMLEYVFNISFNINSVEISFVFLFRWFGIFF